VNQPFLPGGASTRQVLSPHGRNARPDAALIPSLTPSALVHFLILVTTW
jgi:hypothetical protein